MMDNVHQSSRVRVPGRASLVAGSGAGQFQSNAHYDDALHP